MFEKAFINSACEKAVRSIAAGDKNALAVIYDKMSRHIYSVARSILNNHADAEDALQNTLCEILRCAPSYKGGSAYSWILAIARNQSLNIIRSKNKEISTDTQPYIQNTDMESELICLDALSQLNENEREAVVLKVYCRCRHKEIAELLGISVSAAEKLYQRGIAKLRQYYREEEFYEKRKNKTAP